MLFAIKKNYLNILLISAITFVLAACLGGGGGGGSDSSGSSSASAGSASSVGTITGFGSVFVNGVRFNTSNAEIIINEQQAAESDLALGMVVAVSRTSSSSSTASRVEFEENVKGPVDVNDNSGTFSALGQTIITNAQTVFDNGGLAALVPGVVVEVSGFRDNNDNIIATFVENKGAPGNVSSFEVIGNVRNLNTGTMTFQIDDLNVNYGSANLNDFASGMPSEGQLVEVKDETKVYVANSLSLNATEVEPQVPLGGDVNPGDEIEIENIVTQVISATAFVLGGVTVITNANTQFLFGTADQIVVGTRLEAEGSINGAGMLVARKIKFEDNDVRIIGSVFAKGIDTLTMLDPNGVIVTVTDQTELEDDTSNNPLTFADIQVGNYLEIRGFTGPNSTFIASELEREDPDQDARLRGPVGVFDAVAGTVTVLGITVSTSSQTQFEGLNDQVISASAFFNSLTSGLTIVQAQWDPFNNISDSVMELELED